METVIQQVSFQSWVGYLCKFTQTFLHFIDSTEKYRTQQNTSLASYKSTTQITLKLSTTHCYSYYQKLYFYTKLSVCNCKPVPQTPNLPNSRFDTAGEREQISALVIYSSLIPHTIWPGDTTPSPHGKHLRSYLVFF